MMRDCEMQRLIDYLRDIVKWSDEEILNLIEYIIK